MMALYLGGEGSAQRMTGSKLGVRASLQVGCFWGGKSEREQVGKGVDARLGTQLVGGLDQPGPVFDGCDETPAKDEVERGAAGPWALEIVDLEFEFEV